MKNSIKYALFLSFLVVSFVASLASGDSGFSLKELLLGLKGSNIDHVILFKLRLPRVVFGFFVGGALSVCGVILQALFRNPLTEPYTLGVSGGAALGVVISSLFNLERFAPLSGFLGSMFIVLTIYGFTIKKGRLSLDSMLLVGVMTSFISSSLVLFIMALSDPQKLHGIIFWMMGSLQWPTNFALWLVGLSSVSVAVIAFLFSWNLNALSIGEEDALYLGVDVETTKRVMFFISSLAVGISVSFAGIIGFVGLVVPHFFRIVFSQDHRFLVLLSFFGGGAFLILCDAIARSVVAPVELPVGVITGIIGGLAFIWAFLKTREFS
ncbi:FecCD family ABC transporter permease [Hippea maritima]|uniref:ABC-type transporter, integral membrane subunit n=1 Tax=Hippea maritima (strain ATCC 700847 / DSM 10411 / MH2) TaxID=760142 RepID=F2LWK5_HIPMA|nr:iron ABC transporter permease [Hippea maritima]AEA34114.1 ABC-type transporter, integral membrane subunit [Hippea maritima DSM 10411]